MANNKNGANLGFENQLWAAVDKMRGHMDASEYKHVVLGLIFLKYISDAFQAEEEKLAYPVFLFHKILFLKKKIVLFKKKTLGCGRGQAKKGYLPGTVYPHFPSPDKSSQIALYSLPERWEDTGLTCSQSLSCKFLRKSCALPTDWYFA